MKKVERNYITGLRFEKLDLTNYPLEKGEYEQCTFVGCHAENADFSHINFADCEFVGCNLSLAKLSQTALRGVQFKDCKMLGIHFEHCSPFLLAVSFEQCVLNLSVFYQSKLKKTVFKQCSLREVDFSEADLTAAVLDDCDLAGATFDNTILEKADMRTAYNYTIAPNLNRIRQAKFSMPAVVGLLDSFDIRIE